jgi:hypothetical protein
VYFVKEIQLLIKSTWPFIFCFKKQRFSFINNKEKRAGGMAQVLEHLPSKQEALTSSTSIKKKLK